MRRDENGGEKRKRGGEERERERGDERERESRERVNSVGQIYSNFE